ncbi:type 2 isopentenyl-diphosphate Delta-isomerase [Gardnerella vaginalis]|uniref:Isopentenyl-diphosphate delta-isomerase n=1 Tax=Gardnerella vaginalis TaxID=2702 RepID=A0A133NPH9_GARVA|nr:type 2 isopentenyl-diphosphate Delta-isomerase [Gardnerella vaginalis]KXA18204.1 isopentenyl-diphosphate delta-isomerase, type 2 [Gardnerella vaginalis]
MTKFQAEAPGKLYIAGEYAVVDGKAAIVAAVNRYVKVTVDAAGACDFPCDFPKDADCGGNFYGRNFYGKIACEDKNFEPLYWKFDEARFGGMRFGGNSREFILDKSYGCGFDSRADACDLPAEESPATNDLPAQTNVEKIKKYYAYVISAMNVVDEYAREMGVLEAQGAQGAQSSKGGAREYNVRIESDLDDKKTGKKYGLGSSAAVTVAAVRALCEWYGLAIATPELCKLAIIASSLVKKSGSGGDVAASVYGGWVLYRAYNREWLKAEVEMIESGDSSLCELLQKKWPRFVVKRLKVGGGLRLLVGWTGSPASSAELVGSVKAGVKAGAASGANSGDSAAREHAKTHAKTYEDFCAQSEKCVQKIAKSLENGDFNALLSGFAQNRALLKDLGEITGTLIETPKLTRLIEAANCAGLPAKTSGAGGGDCGIAIARSQDFDAVANRIKSEWQKNGIEALGLQVAEFDENRDSSLIEQRKNDHIKLACKQYKSRADAGFEAVRFIPNALPQLALSDVDTSVSVLGAAEKWAAPLYINAMTGGSKNGENINASLARVAAKTGVAMACGSLSAALKNPQLAGTFSVIRRFNPRGFVMANVSAGVAAEQAIKAVEILQANALQIHLNAAQELVMSEGDRDFSAWLSNIEAIVSALDSMKVPVVVKETGCGMSARDVLRLQNVGVRAVDVGGRGGTNFVAIENARRGGRRGYEFLDSWGLTTVESLLDIARCDEILRDYGDSAVAGDSCDSAQMQVFASGGVRTPLDVVRALKLGASAVGVAGEFLHTLTCGGMDALVEQIEDWKTQIRVIMALLGCRNIADLRKNSRILIDGKPCNL